jgi:signal transduction histidine kinase
VLLYSSAARASVQDALPALVAQLTHDLNNQLTTIMGQAELALMGQDPQRWHRALQDVYEAGVKSQRLVADMQKLLSWGAAEHGPIPLREAVSLALRLSERRLESTAIAIELQGDSAQTLAHRGGDLVVAIWTLLSAARAVVVTGARNWSLELSDRESNGWQIRFRTPELDWSADPRLLAAIASCQTDSGPAVEGLSGEVQLRRR